MPEPSAHQARLNPFAFPSDTTLRFALLIIFALCGSAELYGELWDMVYRQGAQALESCVSSLATLVLHLKVTPGDAGNIAELTRSELLPRIGRCSELFRPRVIWQVSGILVTAASAACLYYLIPRYRLWRDRLQPVCASEPPGLQEELQVLCQAIALPTAPRLFWNPVSVGMPVAFGTRGRYCIGFSGGSVVRLYADRAAFRSIALHELAHIRSGDIDKAYLTIATAGAFFLAVLAPMLVACVFVKPRWSDVPDLLLSATLWGSTIMLSGASVLRAREYYADVQASAWEGTNATIDRVLSMLSGSDKGSWKYIGLHPPFTERRKAVADPSQLFPLGVWDAFAVGVAAWLALGVVRGITVGIMYQSIGLLSFWLALNMLVLPACFFLLAVGAVGTGVWRGAFAALVKGEAATTGTGRVGLALGASAVVPAASNLVRAVFMPAAESTTLALQTVAMDIGIGLIVTISCLLVFKWIAEAVTAWLRAVLHSRSPWPILLLTISAALVLVTATFSWATFFAYMIFIGGFEGTSVPTIMFALVVGPPMVFASLLVWAFPLVGPVCYGNSAQSGCARWIFLEPAAYQLAPDEPGGLSGTLAMGIVSGLGSCLLLELVYFRSDFPFWASRQIGSAFDWLTALVARNFGGGAGGVILVFATLFQGVAATIAAAAAPRFRALSGLAAASVAGGIIAVFNLLFLEAGSEGVPAMLLSTTVLLGCGAIVALPMSISMASAKSWFARRRGSGRFADTRTPTLGKRSTWSLLRRGLFASLLIVVVTGLAVRLRTVFQAEQDMRALRAAAEAGDSTAERNLGIVYFTGRGVPEDDALAVDWFRKAAEKGNVDAQNYLGLMYNWGRGAPRNDTTALAWFRKAADQGNAAAQVNLGMMYHLGFGTPRDDAAAVALFRKAAEQGSAEAQFHMGEIYEQGGVVPRNDQQAVVWLRKAADQGYASAGQHLQLMCQRGVQIACAP